MSEQNIEEVEVVHSTPRREIFGYIVNDQQLVRLSTCAADWLTDDPLLEPTLLLYIPPIAWGRL